MTIGKDTTHVRVDVGVVAKVKKITERTKQTVGGYFELAAKEKIDRDNKKFKAGQDPAI